MALLCQPHHRASPAPHASPRRRPDHTRRPLPRGPPRFRAQEARGHSCGGKGLPGSAFTPAASASRSRPREAARGRPVPSPTAPSPLRFSGLCSRSYPSRALVPPPPPASPTPAAFPTVPSCLSPPTAGAQALGPSFGKRRLSKSKRSHSQATALHAARAAPRPRPAPSREFSVPQVPVLVSLLHPPAPPTGRCARERQLHRRSHSALGAGSAVCVPSSFVWSLLALHSG